LSLTERHEELSRGWVSDIASCKLLESRPMLSDSLTKLFSLLFGCLIRSKVSVESLSVFVHRISF
jgi:hypothetical protein